MTLSDSRALGGKEQNVLPEGDETQRNEDWENLGTGWGGGFLMAEKAAGEHCRPDC